MSNQPYTSFDFDKIGYQTPAKNPKGQGAMAWIQHKDHPREKPRIQLEKSEAPFGMQMSDEGKKKLAMDVTNPQFEEFLRKLDEHNINMATENSEAWFKKSMSRETVETLYKPLFRPSTDPKWPSKVTLKFKDYGPGDEKNTKVFVMQGDKQWTMGSFSDVQPHCEVVPIVEFQFLWFVGTNFGASLAITDLLVYPTSGSAVRKEFDFILPTTVTKADDDSSAVMEE